MIAQKVFLVLQGLLLAAQCDVWPRDQELKDGEDEQLKHVQHQHQDGWDHGDPYGYFGTGLHSGGAPKESPDVSENVHYPPEHGHANPSHGRPSEDGSEDAEGGSADTQNKNTPMRMGNWCAFVQKREVTMAVACGNEKYIIKSQSPCPNGTPDCHLIMYKMSTRPVYREKQKIFTALLWRCCPGHGGKNCEDIVENGHVSESEVSTDIRHQPGDPELNNTGPEKQAHDQNQELNDHQESGRSRYEPLRAEKNQMEEQDSYDHTPSPHTGHEPHYERGVPNGVDDGHRHPPPETHYTNPGLVPIHYLKDVMMSHLQPIFDSFNLTLARLSEEVRDLQKDMSVLQLQQMLQGESKVAEGGTGEESEQHEAMTNTFQQLEELNMQLGLQRDEMEEKLHAQQAMLHYNLTTLKTDMDMQIKRKQKTLQISLHSLNSSLSEVKEKQEQLEEELHRVSTLARQISSPGRQHQEDTAVWEAITRLDNKVINNTIQLSTLNEHQVQVSGSIEHLEKGWKTLEKRITQNDHKNEERYIEAFLEVDAAKATAGKYAEVLKKNFTILESTVHDLESDVNHLFMQFYNISFGSRDCDCTRLSISVAQLKQAVANITVIANENRLALDNAAEERVNLWENGGWGQPVEEIKLSLYTVQNSLVLEQEKRRTLQQNLNTLQTSLSGSQKDIEALQQGDSQKASEIKYLNNSFSSLLKDAIRHTDVLEILLGEEVLEFFEWSMQEQEAHSIPVLKMLISDLQEQINSHSRSLASMLNSEDPTAGEPSEVADWLNKDLRSRRKEQNFDHFSEDRTGYQDRDFFALEKTVEQLRTDVVKLGEQQCLSCCNCAKGAAFKDEEKLQAEMTSVRKSLDDHLRIFNSLFSNTEGLTESEATVDLDKLFALMKKKEAKLQRKRQKKKADTRGGQRSKRHTPLETTEPSQIPGTQFMFLASLKDGVNVPGTVVFETTSLNHGQTYSPETGTFRAPSEGVYLFLLRLNFGPGTSLAQLKRGQKVALLLHQSVTKPSGPVTRSCLVYLQQGEEVHLELVQGTLEHGKPEENTFAAVLLQTI